MNLGREKSREFILIWQKNDSSNRSGQRNQWLFDNQWFHILHQFWVQPSANGAYLHRSQRFPILVKDIYENRCRLIGSGVWQNPPRYPAYVKEGFTGKGSTIDTRRRYV